jgi:alpha-mannosidase
VQRIHCCRPPTRHRVACWGLRRVYLPTNRLFISEIMFKQADATYQDGILVSRLVKEESAPQKQMVSLNRRQFVAATAATAIGFAAKGLGQSVAPPAREVFLVPNFHPASCGWLTTFSRERVYCANSYLDHLDRVRDDPHYFFVMSEVNNFIAIMNFQPERIPELKQRIQEKRVELVNGFFLESTINLSGGEALVRLGVEGLRWYDKVVGVRPKYAWNIDVCGTHDQMPQIAAGLGFDAMVYTRSNPTSKTIYWSVSPDGSRILTLCPGGYSEENPIFKSTEPLSAGQLGALEKSFEKREPSTPQGAPILVLAGSGDYSLAPVLKTYPAELLEQWNKAGMQRQLRFSTLSDYVDPILPRIRTGAIEVPTFHGGTAYDFDAFWIECNEVKTRYRSNEQAIQAAEMLATVASLNARYDYPVEALRDCWILMCLNMDRNTLWGSAGGMVFVSENSWDVNDRFNWVKAATGHSLETAGQALLPEGHDIGLFNPLNWKRKDPVALQLPPGTTLEGVDSEALPGGAVLCQVEIPSVAVGGWKLAKQPPHAPAVLAMPEVLETKYYSVRIDSNTGALTSLKFKKSGRELLSGPANVIVAERPVKKEAAPADFMAARPARTRLASSSDHASTVHLRKGPVAYTIEARGTFLAGGAIRRLCRFYHESPRIDFETELNDIPTYTVVVSEFPLATDISEIRRGIPFGFSHGAWTTPNPNLHGWTRGIVPTVRWIDYSLEGGGGIAILDRGVTGREVDGRTPIIYLLNAEDEYHGFPNPWLTGKGTHVMPYSLLPHEESWEQARVPHAAWEYNREPILIADRADAKMHSFLETSNNVIVEALRCEGNHAELRLVECFGVSGTATVQLSLPHRNAMLTDLVGNKVSALSGSSKYQFPVRAQQIVTMQFELSSTLPTPEPILQWDAFVPKAKLAALHAYELGLKGHPPFGDGENF